MRNILLVFISIIFLGSWQGVSAQEVVVFPGKESPPRQHKSQKTDTLDLPFIDDFAYPGKAPDASLWADSGAYINNVYPVNPPTLGVATFDGVNREGMLYENASFNTTYEADQLISQPIDLNYPGDRSIYLSFYYQAQGIADAPEPRDSLLVDFYAPAEDKWYTQWSAAGKEVHDFRLVMIPVHKQVFLQEGFRFRFRNHASLSGNSYPARASNCDHWHIDYVYLNRNRNAEDTVFNDIAFVSGFESFLEEYETMPWKHYRDVENIPHKKNNLVYRNLDNIDRLIDTLEFIIHNRLEESTPDTIGAGGINVLSNSENTLNRPLGYQFKRNKKDSAVFNIAARLTTDNFDRKANNKVVYTQRFYHDYGYDDGTAEAGYGLSGEGTQYAQMAYKYHTYEKDTLRGVKIYFNSTLNNYTEEMYFYLTVWDNDNGKPGEKLYSKTNYRPEFDSLNQFHTYPLKAYQNDFEDTAIVVQDTFYIGWMQTTNEILNVGLDLNRNAQNKMFNNIYGNWKSSDIEGALMMRPVFGPEMRIPAGMEETTREFGKQNLVLYPNPVRNDLHGRIDAQTPAEASVFNASGQLMWKGRIQGAFTLNVADWPAGFYVLKAQNQKNLYTGKFLIQR